MIILTDFHIFTVNQDKVKKLLNLNISAQVSVCDIGQIFQMTKTS